MIEYKLDTYIGDDEEIPFSLMLLLAEDLDLSFVSTDGRLFYSEKDGFRRKSDMYPCYQRVWSLEEVVELKWKAQIEIPRYTVEEAQEKFKCIIVDKDGNALDSLKEEEQESEEEQGE